MTHDDLIASACQLKSVSASSLAEFSAKREILAAAVNGEMAARSDLLKLVGLDGKSMSEDNNRNFSLFMESLFSEFQPEVLVHTVLWVFRTYRAHGFFPTYWPANLDCWRRQMQQELSTSALAEVLPYYEWLILNIPSFTLLTDSIPTDADAPSLHHHSCKGTS